jgi:hypothetical protein
MHYSVTKMTCYVLDRWDSVSCRNRIVSVLHLGQTSTGTYLPSCAVGITASNHGCKVARMCIYLSPPSGAEIKNIWNCISTVHGVVLRHRSSFTFIDLITLNGDIWMNEIIWLFCDNLFILLHMCYSYFRLRYGNGLYQ